MDQNNQSQKKIWINIVVVIIIMLSIITIIGSLNDFETLLHTISNIKIHYFIIALIIALISFLLMSLSSFIVLRAINKKLSFGTGFLIQTVEPFFNGITPFSSGAQPFQIYYYHKHHVEVEESTSVLAVNFILYQIVTVILSTLGITLFWDKIYQAMGINVIYILIGYSINTLILIMMFLMAYVNKVYRLFENMFGFFQRFKLTKKHATNFKNKTKNFVGNFQNGVRFLFTKKRVFILGTFTKLISIILTYLTTVFIAMSLDFSFDLSENIYMIFASVIAVNTMMFVPLPGASGGTEAAFTGLMAGLFLNQSNTTGLVTIMLLWRIATYYFSMLYGFIGYLILQKKRVVTDENRDI